uniref:importin-4 isoform X2 n=1 Tax=Myxine glutinosa TaxID=7769 RepID=UPI00358EC45C
METPLEVTLSRLLEADTSIIQEATAELRIACKDRGIIPALCSILSSSSHAQIRQLACVLLRRCVSRRWRKTPAEVQQRVKPIILESLQRETEIVTRNAVANLAADVARLHPADRPWLELLSLVRRWTESESDAEQELGLLLLSVLLQHAPSTMAPHAFDILRILAAAIGSAQHLAARYYATVALSALAAVAEPELNVLRDTVPKIIHVVRQLIIQDEATRACRAMEVFDEFIDLEISIIAPHLRELTAFCMELAGTSSLEDSVRMKAFSVVGCLARMKSKALVKHQLLDPILNVIFVLVTSPCAEGDCDDDEDEDDDDEIDTEGSTPRQLAIKVMEDLAMNLPPEKLFGHVMSPLSAALDSDDPWRRRGGLALVAALAEGCAGHIRLNFLPQFLKSICTSLCDENHFVQASGLYALGQFSQHLRPDISRYAEDVLPRLLGLLARIGANAELQPSPWLNKAYYALDNFVESLEGDRVLPFLPALVEHILGIHDHTRVAEIKELSLSALGSIAVAAGNNLQPYFPRIIECLQLHLCVPTRPDSTPAQLQLQALDTLGVVATALGDAFAPHAAGCCQLALRLLQCGDDPDLHRCTYGLFASVSGVMGQELAPYLPNLIPLMMLSLRSNEGIVTHFDSDDETEAFALFEDSSDDGEEQQDEDLESEDEDVITGYSVSNAYLEEKEDTCNALGEIASKTGSAFLPYLEGSFEEVQKLTEHPHSDVRKASLLALAQFVCSLHKTCSQHIELALNNILERCLMAVLGTINRTVQTDTDRNVVMAALEGLNRILTECQAVVVAPPGRLQELARLVQLVLDGEVTCQSVPLEDADEDEEKAEYEAMVAEYAGDTIPLLAKAAGGTAFLPHFTALTPRLLSRMSPRCTIAERSFGVGVLAETVKVLGAPLGPLAQHLLAPFSTCTRDPDPEVRQNAVFGLGVLAEAAAEELSPHYAPILGLLSTVLSEEKHQKVIDNICGAVARMILSRTSSVPLEQVFPVLLRNLPLKEDLEENATVFRCIAHLYQGQHPQVLQHLGEMLAVLGHVLATNQLEEAVKDVVLSVVRDAVQRYPADFQRALASLPPETSNLLSLAAS